MLFMVEMKVIDVVVKQINKSDIVFAKDRKGNWLHKNWCCLQYYEKFDGCPNVEKCMDEDLLENIADEPFIIVGFKCDYLNYLKIMRKTFPDWSERKIRIPYLWERRINKKLERKCNEVINYYARALGKFDLFYMNRPEIHGVFVIATMLRLGYEIELKPRNIVWKIYLIGKRKKGMIQKNVWEYLK